MLRLLVLMATAVASAGLTRARASSGTPAPLWASSPCGVPTKGNFYHADAWTGTLAERGGELVRLTGLGLDGTTDDSWVRIRNEHASAWHGRLTQYLGSDTFPGLSAGPGEQLHLNVGNQPPGATFVLQHLDPATGKWVQDDVMTLWPRVFTPEPACAPYAVQELACNGPTWCVIDSRTSCNAAAEFLALEDTTAQQEEAGVAAAPVDSAMAASGSAAGAPAPPPGCRVHNRATGGGLVFNPDLSGAAAVGADQLAVCVRCDDGGARVEGRRLRQARRALRASAAL